MYFRLSGVAAERWSFVLVVYLRMKCSWLIDYWFIICWSPVTFSFEVFSILNYFPSPFAEKVPFPLFDKKRERSICQSRARESQLRIGSFTDQQIKTKNEQKFVIFYSLLCTCIVILSVYSLSRITWICFFFLNCLSRLFLNFCHFFWKQKEFYGMSFWSGIRKDRTSCQSTCEFSWVGI